jgi:hypothetical protein
MEGRMIKRFSHMVTVLLLAVPIASDAAECWTITNVQGYSAHADRNYDYVKDGFSNAMILCFEADTGTVTGTDTRLVRFGESTLAGSAQKNDIELFEVYQIDRVKGRLLYTKSRIGTKSAIPQMSDVVGSFVGDAKRISQ